MLRIERSLAVFVLTAVLVTLVAACEPQVVEKTVEVEKEVEVTREVEKTVEVEKVVEITPTPTGPRGTLRVALTGAPNSLHLGLGDDQNSFNAGWPLYDSLVYLNPDAEIEPGLAESWELSEDGTEYVFKLREDVTFHNGEPFTADDVVFSWEHGKQDEMKWSDKWKEGETVEKVDDYTVRITTDGPRPLLLKTMATIWGIIPKDYMEEVGLEGFNEHPVGTGPFMFEEWFRGDHITYKANPDYWREGCPKVETLIFRPIPESATRAAAVQAGEIDIAPRLSAEEAQRLMGPDVKVLKYPLWRAYYVTFNNLTTGVGKPTEDARVRQAMNYAVDVQAIIDSILGGYGKPAATYAATTGELGYGAVEPFGYDPDKAQELLTEAGYSDGFSIDMACPAGAYSHFEEVCQAIAGYLGDVGIDTSLEIMESGHYWDLEANKELPPLFGDSWGNPDGEAYPRLLGALGGWDAAYSAWSDPKIDELLQEIGTTVDQDAREALYEELQVYVKENPPFIYLYEAVGFEGLNARVQDYNPLPGEDYWLFDTWVVLDE
ncbi:MAG: ABC transporter substrate-binding protein [Anaerolineae bacterium]